MGNQVREESYIAEDNTIHDISEVINHGREPDWEKDTLVDTTITVYGINGPEDWSLGPVYFVLLKRKEDAAIDDPWGVMFPASSPLVKTVLAMARQKKLPFRGLVLKPALLSNPDRTTWTLNRP